MRAGASETFSARCRLGLATPHLRRRQPESLLGVPTRSPYSESLLGVSTRSPYSESLLRVPTQSPYSESLLGVPTPSPGHAAVRISARSPFPLPASRFPGF